MTQIPLYWIGEFINNMRIASGLTINALSKKSKVCYKTIKKLEQWLDTVEFSTIKRLIETMQWPEEIILDPTHMTNPIQILDEIIKETIDWIANPDDDNSTYEEDNVILKK
jgi:predicted transcriptional regulator